jgi:hypothetical protein
MRKKKQFTTEEIIAHFDKVYEDYKNDPKRAEKIEAYRRKYCPPLTAEELQRTFTI